MAPLNPSSCPRLEIERLGAGAYDRHLEAYEHLARAEAMRLAGYPGRAFEGYERVAEASALYGHRLEQAHAFLGMAEAARMLGQADRVRGQEALALYRRVGSTWGQVQALITLAGIEVVAGGSPAPLLYAAATLAREASLVAESGGIASMASGGLVPDNRRVLCFV